MWALLSPRLLIAIAIAAALATSHFAAYRSGRAAVRVLWDADVVKRTADALVAEQAARKVEQDLQAKSDAIRSAKNAQINSLGLELAESLKRLRNRPERPAASDVPPVAGTGNSCTGASLWREDGEFLRREAARADGIRAALDACQQAYKSLTPSGKP